MELTSRPGISLRQPYITELLARLSAWTAIAIGFTLPISTATTDALFVLLVPMTLLTTKLRSRYRQLATNPAALLFLIFFALYVIGLTYTSAPWHDALMMTKKFSKFLFGIALFTVFMDEEYRRPAINAFLIAMIVTLVLADFFYIKSLLLTGNTIDIYLTKSHIETNFFAAIAAYFLAHRFFSSDKKMRWFYGILLAFVICNVFLSQGRSGYVIFGVLTALFFWQHCRWRGLVYAALCLSLLLGTAFLTSSNFSARTKLIESNLAKYEKGNSATSDGQRLAFTRNSLGLVMQHPIIGTGTGSFRSNYGRLAVPDHEVTTNPHNEYTHTLIQFGLVGLAILVFMFIILWRKSFALTGEMRYLAQGVILAIAFGCLINSWLMDTSEGHAFIFFLAVAFASLHALGKEKAR